MTALLGVCSGHSTTYSSVTSQRERLSHHVALHFLSLECTGSLPVSVDRGRKGFWFSGKREFGFRQASARRCTKNYMGSTLTPMSGPQAPSSLQACWHPGTFSLQTCHYIPPFLGLFSSKMGCRYPPPHTLFFTVFSSSKKQNLSNQRSQTSTWAVSCFTGYTVLGKCKWAVRILSVRTSQRFLNLRKV